MTQSLQSLLTDTFPLRRAWVVDGPEFPTDILPIPYGDLSGGKGGILYCPGIVESTNTYLIADCKILSAANGNSPTFYVDNIVTAASSWTDSVSVAGKMCATVTFGTAYAGSRIGYRGKGKVNGSGVLITNPVEVVQDFLTDVVGVDLADLEPTALADAKARAALAGYTCAGVLALDRSPATTISEILACFGGYYYLSPAGKIVLIIDDGRTPGLSGVAAHLRAQDFETAEATWSRTDVINQAAVNFCYNAYDITLQQKFQDADDGVDSANAVSQRIHGPSGPGVTEAALEFPWTRDAATVRAVQGVIVSRLATPRARIRMQSPGYRLVHLDVGDHVGFSWPRMYDDQARPLKNQIGLIEEVAVDGDNPQVALTIRDTGAYLSRGQRLDGSDKFDGGWKFGADRDQRDY
jgi:hypothetical protein